MSNEVYGTFHLIHYTTHSNQFIQGSYLHLKKPETIIHTFKFIYNSSSQLINVL